MVHKRLVFAIYATMVVCVWWLLAHAESVAGWFLALLLVVLALTADYVITEIGTWPPPLVRRWLRLFTRHHDSGRGQA
jgi:hypothetical protein